MAAPEKIIIQFAKDGDQDLIKAIEKLDLVTKKLISSQGRLNKNYTDLNPKILKLGANLKKQGLTLKNIGIGTELYNSALRNNKNAVSVVTAAVKNYESTLATTNKTTLLGTRNTRNMSEAALKGSVAFSVLRSKLLLFSFAMTILVRPLMKVMKLFSEQQRQLKQLTAVLRSTGFSAGLVTIQLDSMAKGLAGVTRFGDEAIHNVQKLLLTFTKIKDDVFPDALSITLDMAEALGTDASSAAIQLGKALNDPAKGFTALRRVGISFSKTQESQIKAFAKLGDVASAQKVILEELNKEFGGVARNAGTASTRIALLTEAWGDFQERLGEAIAPILMPVLGLVTDLLNSTKSESEKLLETLGTLGQTPMVKEAQIGLLKQQLSSIEGISKVTDAYAVDKLPLWQAATHDVGVELESLDKKIKATQGDIEAGTLEVINFANANKMSVDELKAFVQENDMATVAVRNRHGATTEAREGAMKQKLADKGITEELKNKILTLNDAELKQIETLMAEKIAMADISVKLTEIGIAMGFVSVNTDDATEKWKLWAEAASEAMAIQTNAYSAMTSAQSANLQAREKNEIDALKATDKYKRMSSKRQQDEEAKIADKFRGEKKKIWQQEKNAKLSQAMMSGYAAVTKAFEQFGYPWGLVPAAIVAGMVAQQIQAISSTPMPKFARGGMVGGRPHAQGGTMIEAERGEFVMSANAVKNIGMETMNRINEGGGAGNINISFSGNVMSQDFIENEAIPQIKEAIRRGADIGVS